jgi:hypothetical protein
MIKLGIHTLLPAVLLLVSVSFAKADDYSITSDWTTGATIYGDLVTYTGDGTFSWNGTTFSLISFSFTETSPSTSTVWTASAQDGELYSSGGHEYLAIGNGPPPDTDCQVDCISVELSASLATGGPQVLTGLSGTSEPNTTFVDATVTDTSYVDPVPEPTSVVLFLTFLGITGYTIRKKRQDIRF